MLSGETAVGKFPTATVEMMHKIAIRTEQSLPDGTKQHLTYAAGSLSATESVAKAACRIAYEVEQKL